MPDKLVDTLKVTRSDQALRLRWVDIKPQDLELIREAAPLVRSKSAEIVKAFYDHSEAFPEFNDRVRRAGSQRSRLESAQTEYLLKICDATFDEEYFEHRLRVGLAHAKLNIEPRWNVGNYAIYGSLLFLVLADKFKGKKLAEMIAAFNKAFMLDASLAVETYISEGVLEKLVDIHDTLGGPLRNLGLSVGQVDLATREIANASQEVARGASSQTATMSEFNAEMDRLGESSATVAQAASLQLESIGAASAAMAELGTALGRAQEAARAATARANESLGHASEGTSAVRQTMEGMEAIRATVLESAGEIEELGKHGSQIGAIVQVIDDIAAQTNLLALNAAIEAARAGEQGRGFAVVAENVRSLAERTAVATKEIAALISGVQRGTERAVRAMEASIADVERGAARARAAGGALEQIVDSARLVGAEVAVISTAMESVAASTSSLSGQIEGVSSLAADSARLAREMNASSERVRASVGDATAIAEQSAAASQQVSASVEEVSAQMSEVARDAKVLSDSTTELGGFIARFGSLAHNSRGESFVDEARACVA